MELYQIRYFLALCETVNFARAAERCGVSQPSLTRAMQKLERELGGLLIRRERRHTHLTELGNLVRPMLEEVLAHAARAKTAAERHLSDERAVLRLGIMSSIGLVRLAPFLAHFGTESPDVELRLVEAPAATIYDALFDSSLDAAVMTYCSRLNKRLRYDRLYSERLVAVMPRGHPFEKFEATRLRDLRDQSFLLRTNCELGHLPDGHVPRARVRAPRRLPKRARGLGSIDGRLGIRGDDHAGVHPQRCSDRGKTVD